MRRHEHVLDFALRRWNRSRRELEPTTQPREPDRQQRGSFRSAGGTDRSALCVRSEQRRRGWPAAQTGWQRPVPADVRPDGAAGNRPAAGARRVLDWCHGARRAGPGNAKLEPADRRLDWRRLAERDVPALQHRPRDRAGGPELRPPLRRQQRGAVYTGQSTGRQSRRAEVLRKIGLHRHVADAGRSSPAR